ncbi:hypothetical protein FAZ95_17310 [Trinickia violacea]|uniref:Uncharacterized protein n=1 Tax=Trinickia violacea TaxID=2571746 RepID=A0A4P8INZ5_9BURK|nr:hypothetical protein [Trinickia violacea]QCP50758.1 hypothetical protein FAZ95_17310 [Trinickia violacea]
MSATRKILIALVAAIVFDLLVFRSGWYASITTTESMQGFSLAVLNALKKRPPGPETDVLITGDSRASEGFSADVGNQIAKSQHLDLINAAVPGSDLRDWYYFLQAVDPHCDRYRAIVLTLPTFRAAPPVVARMDQVYHAAFLVPLVSAPSYVDFAMTQRDWRSRFDVLAQWVFDPLSYQADFSNLLSGPLARKSNYHWKQKVGIHFGDGYTGHTGSMTGLAIDPATGAITYPTWLNDTQRQEIDADFKRPYTNLRFDADEWNSRWLTRIEDRYAGSKTRVYVLRLPSTPLPAAIHDNSYELAAFFQQNGRPDNVRVIPEPLLLNLEQPQFFFDNRHLNAVGRLKMTQQLTDYLASDLAQSGSKVASGN